MAHQAVTGEGPSFDAGATRENGAERSRRCGSQPAGPQMKHAECSEADIVRTVWHIYAAVVNPDQWISCLASIGELIGGTGAHLLHFDLRSKQPVLSVAARSDPAALAAYANYFHAVDPWGARV